MNNFYNIKTLPLSYENDCQHSTGKTGKANGSGCQSQAKAED